MSNYLCNCNIWWTASVPCLAKVTAMMTHSFQGSPGGFDCHAPPGYRRRGYFLRSWVRISAVLPNDIGRMCVLANLTILGASGQSVCNETRWREVVAARLSSRLNTARGYLYTMSLCWTKLYSLTFGCVW